MIHRGGAESAERDRAIANVAVALAWPAIAFDLYYARRRGWTKTAGGDYMKEREDGSLAVARKAAKGHAELVVGGRVAALCVTVQDAVRTEEWLQGERKVAA